MLKKIPGIINYIAFDYLNYLFLKLPIFLLQSLEYIVLTNHSKGFFS